MKDKKTKERKKERKKVLITIVIIRTFFIPKPSLKVIYLLIKQSVDEIVSSFN